ncbi:penicillin-binding protein 1B [Oceanobacter sp. 5_MG-2023]|uniref:penicillin-binding protein 1B n=1 Tax=Oceanobacter sp. 5_MG-2023 TaxID=3062645 RepID=UPI0026E1F614|nr:penicillin-binding protein 1B [Oceanobacter sp. 5_MG-2023]MDO6680964.1 penicillin-binding protein 1B [Oceanobacter sp. 5_MG-2023]
MDNSARAGSKPKAAATTKTAKPSPKRAQAPKKHTSAKKAPTAKKASTSGAGKSSRWHTAWRISWQLGLVGVLVLGVWMVFLDARVQQQFDGKKWTLPARVYARPLLLYPGRLLPPAQLQAELEWTDYQSGAVSRPGRYQQQGSRWRIHRRQVNFWDGPQPQAVIELTLVDQRVEQLSVNGKAVPLVRLEPQYVGGIFPSHNEDRELVTLDQVPSDLLAALVVTEDNHFFEHHGISLRGISRALVANIQAGGVVQGGSTLTQQLVKNFFLTSERTLMRKAQEALMAILLELHHSKAEILQAYLNEVYLGQAGRRAIHGIGLASRFYFGKPVQELELAEIATLVGLVKGASYYNPRRHPQRALERRNLVLGLMAKQGLIGQDRYLEVSRQPLRTADSQRVSQREYPAFLERVRKQLQEDYRREDLETEGLNIFTTLDPWIQHALEVSATTQLDRLEARYPALAGKLETAAVITSVDGAEIRAMIGGRQAGYFGFNRALDARRSIGSLAKPVVYLAALRSGRYHWGTLVDDSPVQVTGQDGQLWQPQNYDGKSHGLVPMVDALSHSYNQATARIGMRVGLEQVARTFNDLGLQQEVPPYPSVLLGSQELSPLEVAGVYQTLAARGFVMPLRAVEAVATASGKTLSSYAIHGHQGVAAEQVDWLRYGLEQVVNDGTAKKLLTRFAGPLAGKTGTSDQQRDAWFAGFDNRHLGVVWVGRDDNQPMPLAGSSAALPIWQQTFAQAGVEPLLPTGLPSVVVDADGQILEDGCDGRSMPMPISAIKQVPKPCQTVSKPTEGERKGWLDWLF